jgi:hypothetical protein
MDATRFGCVTNSVTSGRNAALLRVGPIDDHDDLDQRRRGQGWVGDVDPSLDPITRSDAKDATAGTFRCDIQT